MMQAICKHLANHGGSALIGDYGHWGEKEDTFRVCHAYIIIIQLIKNLLLFIGIL